jgi:hypothetical protein
VKVKFPKAAALSPTAQSIGLRQRFPFGVTTWNRRGVRWCGNISPSEFGRRYLVEMQYSIGESPDVWVLNPNLKELADDRSLPHVYDEKSQRLCLYLPGVGLWLPSMALARTILPWASHWLYNFEIWLVTSVWHAEGVHLPAKQKRSNKTTPSAGTAVFI